ncbi:AfsR/SARP family transcriptional regulator [Streptomyces sannanensis]|uniref:AfsR/SARP family transcriptional regulator n=1 Tax=Streptomyces sannanensis TaxID=285536 RepID=UPI0031EBF988
MVRFNLLGPLEVRVHGRPAHIRGGRQRTLLVLLLLGEGTSVSKEQLIDEIWGDDPPGQAGNALQAVVTRLRRSLDTWCGAGFARERLVSEPSGYSLRLDGPVIDFREFESLYDEARRLMAGDPARSGAVLEEALGLWRGPALHGVGGGVLCRSAAIRLDEKRLLALEDKVELEHRGGRYADTVAELHRLTMLYPLHERFSEQLMVALYRSGRPAEALDAYHRLRTVLHGELGLEPTPAVQSRMRAIRRHDMAA